MNYETTKLIQIFADRFINRRNGYYRQHGSKYNAVYEEPTIDVVTAHLKGEITIAAPILDEKNCGKLICYDSDSENGELDRLDYQLKQWDWHTIREGKHHGKDGHLLVLFNAPIPGEYLVMLALAIVKRARISTFKLDVFPKQGKANLLGSAVKLPLCFHQKIGARVWFDVQGIDKTVLAQLRWFAQQKLNDASKAIELAELWKPLPPPRRPVTQFSRNGSDSITFEQAIDLTQARPGKSDWHQGHCPCTNNHQHADRNPSLAIRSAANGAAIVHCHVGCLPKEIYVALKFGLIY